MVIALYVGKVTLLCESGIILVGKIWLALRNHYILGGGGESCLMENGFTSIYLSSKEWFETTKIVPFPTTKLGSKSQFMI